MNFFHGRLEGGKVHFATLAWESPEHAGTPRQSAPFHPPARTGHRRDPQRPSGASGRRDANPLGRAQRPAGVDGESGERLHAELTQERYRSLNIQRQHGLRHPPRGEGVCRQAAIAETFTSRLEERVKENPAFWRNCFICFLTLCDCGKAELTDCGLGQVLLSSGDRRRKFFLRKTRAKLTRENLGWTSGLRREFREPRLQIGSFRAWKKLVAGGLRRFELSRNKTRPTAFGVSTHIAAH